MPIARCIPGRGSPSTCASRSIFHIVRSDRAARFHPSNAWPQRRGQRGDPPPIFFVHHPLLWSSIDPGYGGRLVGFGRWALGLSSAGGGRHVGAPHPGKRIGSAQGRGQRAGAAGDRRPLGRDQVFGVAGGNQTPGTVVFDHAEEVATVCRSMITRFGGDGV